MISFAWRRRLTRHFGEQWVPFAEIALRSAHGRWYSFSLQVDSGAVITVLPRSAAELLGLTVEKGEGLDLAGIGATARRYFVHGVEARIGTMPEFKMRIAAAEDENAPNLLGRLDVLDRFQIDLDPSLEETSFSEPWLDEIDRRIWRHALEIEERILQKWEDHPLPKRVDEAARRFLSRARQLVAAGAGLMKTHHDFELPLILRSMFELSVQFEYLMADPEPRAELYLEFEHVTKYNVEQAQLERPGWAGDMWRESPRRAEGEKRNRAEFDRVRHLYPKYPTRPNSESIRPHWYEGTLYDRAKDVGRLREYKPVYSLYSAWAHGDPWTASLPELAHGGLMEVYTYWARILIQVADAKKIILAGYSYTTLQDLVKDLP